MSFTAAIRSVFTQYVGFSGRARRAEYWWFVLFTVIVGVVTALLDIAIGTDFGESITSGGIISTLVNLALALPSLAVTVRRLHDTDRSGWWILIGLIPIIGAIVLLVFTIQDGTPGQNRFGSSPKHQAVTGWAT